MGPAFLRKYNTTLVAGTTSIRIPIIKAGSSDFAVSGDWTPAAGDVKVKADSYAVSNITNLPTAITMGNTAVWEFVLTSTELFCKQLMVTVADAATKAVEDQAFIVETFGHANAMYQYDPQDGTRLGLTALPNAAADGAGGLPVSDAGGLDLDTLLGYLDAAISSRSTLSAGAQMNLADSAITAAKFDSSTAFPLKSADSGASALVRLNTAITANGATFKTIMKLMNAITGGGDVYKSGNTYTVYDDDNTGGDSPDGTLLATITIATSKRTTA